jgi:hypothetical protein
MFTNKVVGAARTALLEQLHHYYNMGVSCLLLCPTLGSILEPVLSSSAVPFAEGHERAVVDLDKTACEEMFSLRIQVDEFLPPWLILLSSVDKLSQLSLSPYKTLTLQYFTSKVFVQTAFIMLNNTSNNACKSVYKLDRTVCSMLKLASRAGPVSTALYLALYYYRTGRYNEALRVADFTKQRLSQPYILYQGNVDRQRYSEAVGGLSLFRKMKTAWADTVSLEDKVHFIDELLLEQKVNEHPLCIPPVVMADMLLVLSHYRLGKKSQYLQSLEELRGLLLFDEGRCVPHNYIDLSWQILGICQHVVGDLQGALLSYHESLKRPSSHRIQAATEKRIAITMRQLEGTRQS